jgi:hypothetical protein
MKREIHPVTRSSRVNFPDPLRRPPCAQPAPYMAPEGDPEGMRSLSSGFWVCASSQFHERCGLNEQLNIMNALETDDAKSIEKNQIRKRSTSSQSWRPPCTLTRSHFITSCQLARSTMPRTDTLPCTDTHRGDRSRHVRWVVTHKMYQQIGIASGRYGIFSSSWAGKL